VGAWGARKGRMLLFTEKSFELTAETKYGGTVTNVKRKRVQGAGGSSYSKTTRAKTCVDMWDSQQTTV